MNDMPLLYILSHMTVTGYVILGALLLLSVVSLAVVFQKTREQNRREAQDAEFHKAFRTVRHFPDLPELVRRSQGEGLRAIALAALQEEETFPLDDPAGIGEKTRAELLQEACERQVEIEHALAEERLSWLVVASSTGPFLGLLGTVWGIMDAFFRIGQQASASLNVVAPGIAEALLTTLAGLLVAVPAAAAHQLLSARVRRMESDYMVFASRISSLYRRDGLPGQAG
jgi:biopolymer transport protein TolQ